MVRLVVTALAWLCVAVALMGSAARRVDSDHQAAIVLSAGAWVLTLAIFPAALLFAVTRHWWSLTVVAAVIIAQLVTYGPSFSATTAPSGQSLTVMTQNLHLGLADARAVVDEVRTARVDVLVLQELTVDAVDRLRAAGLDTLLPHAAAYPGEGLEGNGVWSRYPLTGPSGVNTDVYPGFLVAGVKVSDQLSLTVVGLHAASPWRDSTRWVASLAEAYLVSRALVPPGPAIAAGDFNATIDNTRFRALLVDGWSDGAEQAGAGIVRTWPADRAIPPLLGLDHVLTRGAVATSLRTVDTPGTDHRGLVTRIVLTDSS